MLPEQAIRNYYTCRRQIEVCEWAEAMHYMASVMPKDSPEAYTPHTLTGDAWRAAMDAQDQATDAALDAIY